MGPSAWDWFFIPACDALQIHDRLGCTTHGGKHADPPPMYFFDTFEEWDDGDASRRRCAETFLGHGLMCATPSATAMRLVDDDDDDTDQQRWAARDGANGDRRFATVVDAFLATPRTKAGIYAQRGGLMRFNTRDELAMLRDAVPVHVVTGDGDCIMPPGNAEKIAACVGGARVQRTVLEGTGHLWWLGGPQRRRALDAVVRFMGDAEQKT